MNEILVGGRHVCFLFEKKMLKSNENTMIKADLFIMYIPKMLLKSIF